MPATTKGVLDSVNVGDEVMTVVWDHYAEPATIKRYIFRRVDRVTPKRVFCGMTGYDKSNGVAVENKGRSHKVKPVDAAARKWREDQQAKSNKRRTEEETYREREDVQLARRISYLDVDYLVQLGVDKLKRIVAIMDEPAPKALKPVDPCPLCGDTVGVCECG